MGKVSVKSKVGGAMVQWEGDNEVKSGRGNGAMGKVTVKSKVGGAMVQ